MHGVAEGFPDSPKAPSIDRRPARWRWVGLLALAVILCLILLQRHALRAHYWAWQLASADSLEVRARYLNAIMSVGEAGRGAIRRIESHDDASIRMLAVILYQALPESAATGGLRRLMHDDDIDVRESAAMGLAFFQSASAISALSDALTDSNPDIASAAAAALSRADAAGSPASLAAALRAHPSARVRAQSAESIGAWLLSRQAASSPASREVDRSAVASLLAARADSGRFEGLLSLEREVMAARAFAASRGMGAASITGPSQRTVGEIAADQLMQICGEPMSESLPADPLESQLLACLNALAQRRADANRLDGIAESAASQSTDTSDIRDD